MPNNKPQEWFFESAGKSVDRTIDKWKQKLRNAKEAVYRWVESSVAYVWKKAEQWKQLVQNWLNALSNTYRNVSDKIKTGLNTTKERAIRAINNGKEWATNQLKQLDWALKNIDQAIKNGTLKAIKRSIRTGTMVLIIWKEQVTYSINTVKQQIKTIWNAIKDKTIQEVKFAKEKGMLILNTGKNAIKVSTAAALSAGLVFYRRWKLMINKSKLAINKVGKKIENTARRVGNAVDKEIAQGRREAADYLRNTANKIDPRYIAATR